MKKQKMMNWIVTILFLVALAVIYCFWGCSLDMVVTIIAVIVAVIGILVLSYQNARIRGMSGEEQ